MCAKLRHVIPTDSTKETAMAANAGVSETVRTIVRQARAQGVKMTLGSPIAFDENTVSFGFRRRGYLIKSKVQYVPGLDLYNITVARVDFDYRRDTFGTAVAEKTYEGVYADQLGELCGTGV